MARRVTFSMVAADPNGICEDQQAVGAGNLTIDGALATGGVATLDVARHVSLESSANLSAITFTFTGTDRFGNAITEAVTGPNATTTTGAKNFKTVTNVAVDGAVGTDVEIGSADEAETQWLPVDDEVPLGTVYVVITTGAGLTYALQVTPDDVQAEDFQENDAVTFVPSAAALTGETTSQVGVETSRAVAARIAVTGHSTGGFTATILQEWER